MGHISTETHEGPSNKKGKNRSIKRMGEKSHNWQKIGGKSAIKPLDLYQAHV